MAIEVDGKVHEQEEVKLNDEERQSVLEKRGLKVLRFTNQEVLNDLHKVIARIELLLFEPNEGLRDGNLD